MLLVCVNALKRQHREGWRADRSVCAGPLLEGGVHWVDLMTNLGLDVRDVTARRFGREGEDSVHVLFEYAGGAVGALSFSWEAFSPLRGARVSRIYGRRGSVAFESNGAFVAVLGRRPSLYVTPPSELSGQPGMWRAFLHAVATGSDPDHTLLRARGVVELVDRIYRDLRTTRNHDIDRVGVSRPTPKGEHRAPEPPPARPRA